MIILRNGKVWDGSDWIDSAGPPLDVQEFTSSGTWNKPTGTYSKAIVICIGGGGAGGTGNAGGSSGFNCGGGGGSAGEKKVSVFDLTDLPASVSLTVGLGGTCDNVSDFEAPGIDGTDGGDSVFGSGGYLVFAEGGKGGKGAPATSETDPTIYGFGGEGSDPTLRGGDSNHLRQSTAYRSGFGGGGGGDVAIGASGGPTSAGSGGAGANHNGPVENGADGGVFPFYFPGSGGGGRGGNNLSGGAIPDPAGNGGFPGGGGGGGGSGARGAGSRGGRGGSGGNGMVVVVCK